MIIDGDEYRIAWMIPKDDSTVTINSRDFEYLDLCAFVQINGNWVRFFTTERGYGKDQSEGRILHGDTNGIIYAALKVSARNPRPHIIDLVIYPSPAQGRRLVSFERKVRHR